MRSSLPTPPSQAGCHFRCRTSPPAGGLCAVGQVLSALAHSGRIGLLAAGGQRFQHHRPGAGVGGWSVGYRAELAGQARHSVTLGLGAAIGGIVGGSLLLLHPSAFEAIVPRLLLTSVALMIVKPLLDRALAGSGDRAHGGRWWLRPGSTGWPRSFWWYSPPSPGCPPACWPLAAPPEAW